MPIIAAERMTADQFYEFVNRPENRDRIFELERGEIVEMTRPGKFHGFVCGNISYILGDFARKRKKGYVCTNDTGVVVERDPDTVRGPDILFYDDVQSAAEIDRRYGQTPALLSVEGLSPNDTHGKLMRRVREQLNSGITLVWVVDPEVENVTVYRPGKAPYVIESGEEISGEEVLPDFRCLVREFFRMPGQG
jgi:Uma2 family endonuclease